MISVRHLSYSDRISRSMVLQYFSNQAWRIETAYDGQFNAYLVTGHNAAVGGTIVNQVQRTFNGLGQLTIEYQSHSGAVNTATTPKVQYAYSALDAANRSRLTSMTYPNGRVVGYNYATGLDSTISRLSSITDSGVTLESYLYLGLGTVVVRAHAQTGVDLSSVKLSGESVGDAGDQVTGLDRFGRIVDQRWRAGGVDQFRLRIGRHVQMRAVDGRIDGEQLDPHRLAEEEVRPPGVETEECFLHDRSVWTRFAEQV